MEPTVERIMNDAMVYVLDGDRVELARKHILALGITAVPILDEDHRPIGVVSLRDLVDESRRGREVSAPAFTIAAATPVPAAARALAPTEFHHAVVVDADGRAVGMVSAVDLLRALVGILPRHPRAIATVGEAVR